MSKSSPLYEANEHYVSICTVCANSLFTRLRVQLGDEKTALLVLCHYLDVYFAEALYEDTKGKSFTLGKYLAKLNGAQYRGKTYLDYLVSNLRYTAEARPAAQPADAQWSETEQINRDLAIEAIGYDPYKGYEDADRRFLYNDLIRYFDDDSADDPYKLSQIVLVVNINLQIRKIDLSIAKLQASDGGMRTDECKDLAEIKSKLIAANDRIAKENEISVKNRSNKELGKSTLGYLQRDLRQKGFEAAEENYYQQLTSPGTCWAVNMSHKAVVENGLFDENDKAQLLEIQRKLVQDTQRQLDEALEKNRQLHIELAALREEGAL